MRFKLTLRRLSGELIPIDYSYPLSAVVYKVLERADKEVSAWLHDKAYQVDKKTFKLFTFSPLEVPRYSLTDKDRIKILSENIFWTVSFYSEHIGIESFIKGLFINQRVEIADAKSRVIFEVSNVELEAPPVIESKMKLRALSPICISAHRDGYRYAQYLSPLETDYEQHFFENLRSKYRSVHQLSGKPNPVLQAACKLRVLSEPRSKIFTIKNIKVKGYLFDFEIEAPKELIEIGLLGGFGKQNGDGFGYCR